MRLPDRGHTKLKVKEEKKRPQKLFFLYMGEETGVDPRGTENPREEIIFFIMASIVWWRNKKKWLKMTQIVSPVHNIHFQVGTFLN